MRDNEAEQRFEIWLDGELAGFARYQPMGADVRIDPENVGTLATGHQ